MKKVLQRFKEYIKIVKKDDRSGHLGWDIGDVEHEKKNLGEKDYSFIPKKMGGLQGNMGSMPQHWEKGKPSHPTTIDNDRQPRKKQPYHSDDPGQHSLDLKGGDYSGAQHTRSIKEGDLLQHHGHNEMAKEFDSHTSTLNDKDIHHVLEYKRSSKYLNKALRSSAGAKLGDRALSTRTRHLDRVTSAKTTQPLTLYRGVHSSEFHNLPVGHTFTDHGFTGTSLKHDTAEIFAHNGEDIFRIHAPPGTKAYYLDRHDNPVSEEHEVLLHRGTKFKIARHNVTDSGRKVIDLHVLGQRKTRVSKKPITELSDVTLQSYANSATSDLKDTMNDPHSKVARKRITGIQRAAHRLRGDWWTRHSEDGYKKK